MKTYFKHYNDTYYNEVCNFLIAISNESRTHINWNWARWEWMYFHPFFIKSDENKIGLWFSDDKIVGLATYDQYLGEGFFCTSVGFKKIEQEIIDYCLDNLMDDYGFNVAVNDTDKRTKKLLMSNRFVKIEQYENILEFDLTANSLEYNLEDEYEIRSLSEKRDVYQYNRLFWLGFDNEGDVDISNKAISEKETMISTIHLNPELSLFAVDKQGDYISHCCCWYNKGTDYVYIEPVCTIPAGRGKGLARAVIYEALNRCKALGAIKAYVLSDNEFYKKLGFRQHSHYTFYRRD